MKAGDLYKLFPLAESNTGTIFFPYMEGGEALVINIKESIIYSKPDKPIHTEIVEFLFAGKVYVTPKKYFIEHGTYMESGK